MSTSNPPVEIAGPSDNSTPPQPESTLPPTPMLWRFVLGVVSLGLGFAAYGISGPGNDRTQAILGVGAIIAFVAMLSSNLRAVSLRTILFGMCLQVALALLIYRTESGYQLFEALGGAVSRFVDFANKGTEFVFGPLANVPLLQRAWGPENGLVLGVKIMGTIIFVSSVFTVLYYLGVLQLIVRIFARGMIYILGTSGAETLSAVANVFMGQTEAPLIVKPYVIRMTKSELLALMVGGMATISGGIMAIYIQMGADPISILATSVMAAPCGLYLSKLLLPEMGEPETRGVITKDVAPPHQNIVDAAAGGASDGMMLAINVLAMLIAFLAIIAFIDFLLGEFPRDASLVSWLSNAEAGQGGRLIGLTAGFAIFAWLFRHAGVKASWSLLRLAGNSAPSTAASIGLALVGGVFVYLAGIDVLMRYFPDGLSLSAIFAKVFAPLAYLMGVNDPDEVRFVADLLGTKLTQNEFVAFLQLTSPQAPRISRRTFKLCTFALTGFANLGSIGIQLGGIGAMAPERRGDLASLGGRALLVGFLVTIVNASVAAVLLPDAD